MTFKKIIDLTHPIEEGMITFECDWHPRTSIQQLGRLEQEGRESRKLEIGTHTGTHVDAPLHFIANGATIDETKPDILMGKVSIVDFSHLKEDEALTEEMLHGIKVTPRMIFRFGWGKHWGTRKFYHHYPHLSPAAARYLVKKGLKLHGSDIPSPDDSRIKLDSQTKGTDADSPIHKIFLSSGVVLVEYLANLDNVKELTGWHIAALPLKIKGADGAPARVFLFK